MPPITSKCLGGNDVIKARFSCKHNYKTRRREMKLINESSLVENHFTCRKISNYQACTKHSNLKIKKLKKRKVCFDQSNFC